MRPDFRDLIASVRAAGDGACAAGAVALAYLVRFVALGPLLPHAESERSFASYVVYCAIGAALYLAIAANFGLYAKRAVVDRVRSFEAIARASTIWFFAFLGTGLVLQLQPQISRTFSLVAWVAMVVCQWGWRLALEAVVRVADRRHGLKQRVVVVGTSPAATRMAARLKTQRGGLCHFMGYVAAGEAGGERDAGDPILGGVGEFEAICEKYRPDQVLVADSGLSRDVIMAVALVCERRFVDFNLAAASFEVFTSCLQLHHLAGIPVMGVADLPANRIFNRIAKRAMDIAGAGAGLLAGVPVMAVLAILIKRESPGPVFYRQVRVGQGGRLFHILKLRSMRVNAEEGTGARWAVENDPRRTRIGEFMRRTNLDELPQFFNVLKGEMSLVGPRPERPELIPEFLRRIPYYQSRHSVKPGMTGWAQVNGLRGNTSLAERIRHDLEYIEKWSLWWDVVIQFRTFYKARNAY
jgi:exopolysaccharide biosynthesis polyprenyl glycosylphosphotransferase